MPKGKTQKQHKSGLHVQYSRVYWEITSADPFTQAQLKELTLARGFKPGFHGATTLPMYSHLTRGGYACPLALSRVLAGLVLRAQLVRCFQSLSGRCTFSVLVYSTVIR